MIDYLDRSAEFNDRDLILTCHWSRPIGGCTPCLSPWEACLPEKFGWSRNNQNHKSHGPSLEDVAVAGLERNIFQRKTGNSTRWGHSKSGLFSRTHQRRKAPHTLASPDRRFAEILPLIVTVLPTRPTISRFPLGRGSKVRGTSTTRSRGRAITAFGTKRTCRLHRTMSALGCRLNRSTQHRR